jgi:2'-hydroxyisoflavone reductase
MRLLVLGGTVFLGRAVARQARDAGHEVTCAARGVSGRPVDGVRFVTVDRDDPAGLAPLAGAGFDALIDVSSRPSHVRRAVDAFAGRVGHAVYVSSCNAYTDQATPGQRVDEAPTVEPAPPDVDETAEDALTYGRCKVACENAVRDGFGADRSFLCRAGLIVGPEDEMGRFDYWVRRIAAGGEVLVPGTPDDAVQLIDVRDLAGWLLAAAATGRSGTFDGMGPPMTRAEFVAGIAAGVGAAGDLTYVSQEFLAEQGVRYWGGERSIPIWLPLPEYAGFLSRDVSPSLAAGLRCRPLSDTARDTLNWLVAGPPTAIRSTGVVPGIDRDDEIDLLKRWRASSL